MENLQKTIMNRRRVVADSDESSTEADKDMLLPKPSCKSCCACKSSNSKLRTRSKSQTRNQIDKGSPSRSYKEQLEIKLLNDELSEQMSHESFKSFRKQVEGLIELLQSLSLYAQCLQLKCKLSSRIHKITSTPNYDRCSRGFQPDINMISELHEISRVANDNAFIPSDLTDQIDAYAEKYNDFVTASTNFAHVLQNGAKVSNRHLKTFESQFDIIHSNYVGSKTKLDSLLTNVIELRTDVVKKCFHSIAPIINHMVDQDKSMLEFIGSINFDTWRKRSEGTSGMYLLDKSSSSINLTGEEKSCTCNDSCINKHEEKKSKF